MASREEKFACKWLVSHTACASFPNLVTIIVKEGKPHIYYTHSVFNNQQQRNFGFFNLILFTKLHVTHTRWVPTIGTVFQLI